MSKFRNYFIGHFLKDNQDPFDQARAIMVLRFTIVFFIIFLLPVGTDIALGYNKAIYVHGFSAVMLLSFPFFLRVFKNLDAAINFFFGITIVVSFLAFMVLNPAKIDPIGICWCMFFLILSALTQKGKARIIYCCFLLWLPLFYVIINISTNGIFVVDSIVETEAKDPPVHLIFIPIILSVYAIWTHTSTIETAKQTITHQKLIIAEKNKDIIDSILYSKRLQDALLPPVEIINKTLPENFVLYKPKDIVSGDFYWLSSFAKATDDADRTSLLSTGSIGKVDEFVEDTDLVFVAAADCTGHGVPGAMVSIVCSGALTRTVKEFGITRTDLILNKTRELVLQTFERSTAANTTNISSIKDGMDISLLCIDKKNKKISWSGANNPLWYIQDGELKEIKADKQSIGKSEHQKEFTIHSIDYSPGTIFYLFTDGLPDQFGGPKGKKFMYKQFADLLFQHHRLPMKKQLEQLEITFENWKKNLEQVDDVCVIGIRL